jgi:predicted Zn-dependent peptidase
MGNVSEERITSLCKKYLFQKEYSEKEYMGHLYFFLKPRDAVQIKLEKSTFKDSSLSYVYKIKDMCEEDKMYLSLIRDLLTSQSSRLLQKKLRDEEDLIYSSKVLPYPHFGAFEITAFIQKNHKEEVQQAILEVMDELKKEDVVEPLLENIKRRNHINLLRQLDDKYFLLEDYVTSDLGLEESLVEFYQKEEKVTAKDISHFVDRMVLDTILFIEE